MLIDCWERTTQKCVVFFCLYELYKSTIYRTESPKKHNMLLYNEFIIDIIKKKLKQ